MAVVAASLVWDPPDGPVLTLYALPPRPWEADPLDDQVCLYRAESDEGDGPVVGVEIVGFLTFDRWDVLPEFPVLWQLPGQEPLPLVELLKREQQRLRAGSDRSLLQRIASTPHS